MNCYQLSCGHWQGDCADLDAGALLACLKCYSLRTHVIGWARSWRQGASA